MNGYKVLHGLPADAKLGVIAKRAGLRRGEILALWITLMDRASQGTPRGTLENLDAEELAAALDFETAQVETALQALRDKGAISVDNQLTDWDKSQRTSSTLRTREHRARQRLQKNISDNDSETAILQRRRRLQQNTPVSHRKQPPSPIQNSPYRRPPHDDHR